MANDPIHQFHIEPISEPIQFGAVDATFTNASLFMVAGVAAAAGFMWWAMKPAAVVPGRAQVVAEGAHDFIHNMVRDAAGEEGVKKFFPFVFTLFLFIFAANMIGMFPYFFTPTSQIVVTATMALMVFFTVIVIGFAKNGLKFLKLFVPSGIPWYILWLVTLIEVISFFSRPLSHAVRLWANILAGHLVLKVFAGFVPMMAAAGAVGIVGSLLPLTMTVALYALEFLVAFLQAYVFALLTCIYLNDALHPGHH
ncbi:MAG: F0F1 ATP synthase subunit A [Proteobacteria bacterium HN_bin10]|nr:MAG: F0F1 ATP synthase subunit A [Proteobacteria bacterium HN_bin10]